MKKWQNTPGFYEFGRMKGTVLYLIHKIEWEIFTLAEGMIKLLDMGMVIILCLTFILLTVVGSCSLWPLPLVHADTAPGMCISGLEAISTP